MKKWLPAIVVAIGAAWIFSALRPPRDADNRWAVQEFGRLPVMYNGRFQPLDSLARNSLLQLREKQSIYLRSEKRSLSATECLLELMMGSERAAHRPPSP